MNIQDLDNWLDSEHSEDILGGYAASSSYSSGSISQWGTGYASSSSSVYGYSNGFNGFYNIDLKVFSKGKFKQFKKYFYF